MGSSVSDLTLGGVTLSAPSASVHRMTLLLWGGPKSGKTVFGSTAPGKKLWLCFDPDGTNSLTHREDVVVFPLFEQPASVVEKFVGPNPFNVEGFLKDQPDIETVVLDSATTFGDMALSHGVRKAAASVRGGTPPTQEQPGLQGYGMKNTYMRLAVTNLLQSTARMKRHFIIICHEDMPEKNSEGVATLTSILLGSSLRELVPANVSEVWRLTDNGKQRNLYVRNYQIYKPMGTRMFQKDVLQIPINYDLETNEGTKISDWWDRWKDGGFQRIRP